VNQIETSKEQEVIAELRGWHREGCESLFTIGEVLAVDIPAILAAYDGIVAERDAAVRDAQVVREIRARRNVVVEVSPELLKNGAFTDQPLHIMLTENGDGTHLLTFRVSDTIRELRQQLDASQRFSDEAVRAHTECYRRLRKAWVRLAACERVVEAADYFCSYQGTASEGEKYAALNAALDDYRAAVAADKECPADAPHRVVRVALVDERVSEAYTLPRVTDEMVERAAKALYLCGDLSNHWFGTWEQEIARYKETYYEDARAILTAALEGPRDE
jgi:hypothetical protein